VTISLGVGSTAPKLGKEPAELVSIVDKALYEAKREGRDRVKEAGALA
ncbi:MAG: diguanylate cyclase, partial [Deltaproteobacteria bacterium]|nr:diguanylate cyclase [Deltaproteobacteria bacterium]